MENISCMDASLHVRNMRTRIPFEYGITRLTELPHLFVSIWLEMGGERVQGIAADGLAPKWFTKDPDRSYRQELEEMFSVIETAVDRLVDMPPRTNLFELWCDLYQRQMEWGRSYGYPDLLTNFGISLAERALLDAFCRGCDLPFHRVIQDNAIEMELGWFHDELAGNEPSDFLDETPRERVRLRHTVGGADPLTERDLEGTERPEDGLPHTLEENIERYGVRYFKIKLPRDREAARHRLGRISDLIHRHLDSFACTLDGNEVFESMSGFRSYWEFLQQDDTLRSFFREGLLFVEQPVDREMAKRRGPEHNPSGWPDHPPMIIDESDDCISALPEALEQGYDGTSHKNCKGVLKGVANRCLIRQKNQDRTGGEYIMSAEDLSTVGPVSLLQDLSVLATLDIDHAERNGHHYFAGLRMMPADIQEAMLEQHGFLYRRHRTNGTNFPSLRVEDGFISLKDVNRAPFGYGIDLEPSRFTPLWDWSFESLDV